MVEQGRDRRHAVRALAGVSLAAALAPALLAGCAGTPPADTAAGAIRQTLDRRAAAVLAGDENAYLAQLAPGAPTRAGELRLFRNLADVPLDSWEYRLGDVDRRGDTAVAAAELRYRISGHDTAPVTAARTLELVRRDGRWYVTADRAAKGAPEQLWQQGDVQVVRGERSLVLAVGQDTARLTALAAGADRAVPAVSDAWPERWAGRVVVLVPDSVEAMGALLGTRGAAYRGIAAVTTGTTGGSGAAPADRVIVNPVAYGALGESGQEAVLIHETAHVATRAHTSPATPMWLSEGFADWVAYRDTGRTAARTAPELRRAVRAGDLPAALPADADFAFGREADALARAYEGGWLACELIAERWGRDRLTGFYRAVGAGEHRESAVESAMSRVLGTTPAEFTAEWRAFLRDRLGG
ncbi:hypothetical protein [Streptomyces sp. CAU 1734]|uniref:hypothetical protein n=1 Tax=Streptomyces sp. CAU 1734 TaxID=3140360 RepID=UPI0032608CB4